MNSISYLIIDDEPLAHDVIEEYCKDLAFMEKARNCYDALQAISFLNENKVDLLFLDLNMPKLNGFDFLRTLENPPKVIVTSAYKEYALEGFDLNVSDYLLKPFSFSRFLKAINKIKKTAQNMSEPNDAVEDKMNETVLLKGKNGLHKIELNKILYIEANGNYSRVISDRNEIVLLEKISDIEKKLEPYKFVRVHKSFVVPVEKVTEIKSNQIFLGVRSIPIGRVYKKNVEKLIENYL